MKHTVSVIGLGKLGASIAVSIVSRGFKVIGVDVVKKHVEAINSGIPHLDEPGYASLFKKHKKNFIATIDTQEAIQNSDITFIIVPTPSRKNGSFANSYVLSVIKKVGAALRFKKSFHVVALVSTVSPTSSVRSIIPALEKASRKQVGMSIGFCYNPSFVALGNVIANYLAPDMVLIGESDKKSGDMLEEFYTKLVTNKPQIQRMNLTNAEITKLALNTYITTKISYANMLTQLCDVIPEGDVSVVTQALGYDSRIGHKYLQGGLPYGGPCFPRDNKALIALGKRYGVQLPLAQATDKVNRFQFQYIAQKIEEHLPPSGTIGIIGLTYKENTSVLDEAPGLIIAQIMTKKNYTVKAFDSRFVKQSPPSFTHYIPVCQTIDELVQDANLILIASRAKEDIFSLSQALKKTKKSITIIDSWRVLSEELLPRNANIVFLGKHHT